MDLQSIKKSIRNMTDAELQAFIEEMRKKRGRSVTTAKEKEPKQLATIIEGMDAEQMGALLALMEEEKDAAGGE